MEGAGFILRLASRLSSRLSHAMPTAAAGPGYPPLDVTAAIPTLPSPVDKIPQHLATLRDADVTALDRFALAVAVALLD